MSDAVQPQATPSVREDIAFLRALAVEGASSPLFGGSMLVAIGLIYGAACLASWFAITRVPSEAGALMLPIWGSAFAVHGATLTFLMLRLKGRGFDRSTANRANRVFHRTWNAVGLAIMSCLASFTLASLLAHVPDVFAGYPVVVITLYGVGWWVTAAASNERWTRTVALLCFAFAIASGALVRNPNLLLLLAVALPLLMTLPGILLIRKARA
jgi:hypothetical protein